MASPSILKRAAPAARRQALTLSEAAASRIRQLSDPSSRRGAATGSLTPSITQFSATGKDYFALIQDEKGEFDELVDDKGVRILIEPKTLMHVIGTKMDFVDDAIRSEFIFINPNSRGQCGCGESFMTSGAKAATNSL